MSKEKDSWRSASKIRHVALSQPAVRCYWVRAGLCSEEKPPHSPVDPRTDHWHYILPVVAVRTTVVDTFNKRVSPGQFVRDDYIQLEDFANNGWSYDGEEERDEFLVVDNEYGLIGTENALMKDRDDVSCVVFCPWLYDKKLDDAATDLELANLLKRLTSNFLEKQARMQAKAKANKPSDEDEIAD